MKLIGPKNFNNSDIYFISYRTFNVQKISYIHIFIYHVNRWPLMRADNLLIHNYIRSVF